MPYFTSSTGSSAGTTNGHLAELWRSRLSTSDTKTTTNCHCPPSHQGVPSQLVKMSEAPDDSFAVESRETSDSESARPQSDDADEDRDRFGKSDESETSKSESASTPVTSDEAEKNVGGVVPDAKPLINATQPKQHQQQQQQQQQQQSRAGECNLLPVLVERLRSALELSCSSQRASGEDHLPLEDSGVDSEEDLRLWTSMGLAESEAIRPKLDLKFLEELLLSDLQTALARLQDTLKRTDIGTLTRYSSTLDPSNKLHLLRLISNLLAKLKIPEEVTTKQEINVKSHAARRRRAERHTIGVSAEELARARKWLEGRSANSSSNQSSSKIDLEKQVEREGNESMDKFPTEHTLQFDKVRDKCMKDAINQQQSLQIKNRESQKENNSYDAAHILTPPRKFDVFCKDDSAIDQFDEKNVVGAYPQPSAPSKYNKYTAKKSKLKRANTIDIPSYLKQAENNYGRNQHGCNFLRRPINISDKVVFSAPNVVPSFEPKTENDRKFLALINKNTDSVPVNTTAPFKSFNYRQKTSVADKNWTNRFSNIKTTFDKPQANEQEERKECMGNFNEDKDTDIRSVRVPHKHMKNIPNGFTHAPTSAFQKIEKSPSKTEATPFFKTAYLPKSGGLLQEKLKKFDNEVHSQEEFPTSHSAMPVKFRDKPTKTIKTAFQGQPTSDFENMSDSGQLNYQSFCKQFMPFTNHVSSDKRSSVAAKSKFLENLSNEEKMHDNRHEKSKPLGKPFSSSQDSAFAKTMKNSINSEPDNNENFSKQYNYHKQYDVYPLSVINDSANLTHVPDYRYDPHYNRKPLQKFTRDNFEASVQENDYKKMDKPMRIPQHIEIPRFNAPVHHVGVQTTVPTLRPHTEYEPELTYNQCYHSPLMNLQSRNNASVQTIISPTNMMQYAYQTDQTPSSPKPIRHVPHPRTSIYHDHPKPFHAYQSYPDTNFSPNPVYHHPDYSATPYYSHNQPSQQTLLQSNAPLEIPQKPYCSLIEHQDNRVPPEYPVRSYEDAVPYVQPMRHFQPELPEIKTTYASPPVYSPQPYGSDQFDIQQEDEEHIQNQDISQDGVVTRYTSAVATVSSQSVSPESVTEIRPTPKVLKPIAPCPSIDTPVLTQQVIKKLPIYHPNRKFPAGTPIDVIQRHNLLQQSLVRRLQSEKDTNKSARRFSQEVTQKESRLVTSPSFNSGNYSGKVNALKQAYEPPTEGYNTQDKINLFEEKNPSKQHFRPLSFPSKGNVRPDSFPPKMNVTNSPSKQYASKLKSNNQSPNTSIDSSDEYLMSCANKPSRLVLSKSESWHQLTRGSGGNLQVPQNLPPVGPQLLKPPKPKSPLAVRYTKQYEASCSDNVRKMEEKIQRYFHDSSTTVMNEEPKQEIKESKSKRTLTARRNNSLVRSRTMPHIYDDKFLDDNVDVDQAFDSLFKEATRSDDRC